ncbi:MAG TPA: hypothetical protein VN970_04855, partial [Thermoanaerobaculia bacterium]|nr:hypothetical protein [Thermoanaerobaculia bacterium]
MTRSTHTPPPPDAAARRKVRAVVVYAVGQLPPFDAAFYERARSELTEISELLVPPREGRTFTVPAGHFFRIVS